MSQRWRPGTTDRSRSLRIRSRRPILTPTVDGMATVMIDDINVDRAFRIGRLTPIDDGAVAYYGEALGSQNCQVVGVCWDGLPVALQGGAT
jgi:hypothetical protein